MKVGIITFHDAINYGAVFQSLALRDYLRNEGYETEIINYHSLKFYPRNLLELRKKPAFYRIRTQRGYREFVKECKRNQPDYSAKWDKFKIFIDKEVLENKTELINEEMLEQLGYDVIVIGSDQVWNENLVFNKDIYWGNFKTKSKLVVYGASRKEANISDEMIEYVGKSLNNFSAISVREESLKENISKHTDKTVSLVVDPVLLQNADYFDKYEKEPKIKEKYLLLYTLFFSEEAYKCALYIAKERNYTIVDIGYPRTAFKAQNIKYISEPSVSPNEFIGYLKNAEYIVTDSFHGTVFSYLYKKQFYSVYEKDERKDNLLKMLNLQTRHISACEQIENEEIKYEALDDEVFMNNNIASKEYLKVCMNY